MTFVSYAQNYEDVVLYRALSEVKAGFYVDVGAQDPIADSVTRAFYERGWRGINIEPVREWFEKLNADRPHDINLEVAVTDQPGPVLIYEVTGTGMSTTSTEYASRHREAGLGIVQREVPTRSLDSILQEHKVETIHFLKIDAEGAEADVLRSIDLDKTRPWIILLEATEPNSTTPTHCDWESLLVERGYPFAWFDGLNRFYIAGEHFERLRPRLAIPPNYFDHFIRYSDLLVQEKCRNLEEAQGRHAVLNEQHDALLNHSEALEKQRIALGAQQDSLSAERDALEQERDALEEERDSLERELEAAKEDNAALIEQRNALEDTLAQRARELDRMLEHFRDLENQLERARAQAKRRIERMNARLDSAKREALAASANAAAARSEVASASAAAAALAEQLGSTTTRVKSLEEYVSRQDEALARMRSDRLEMAPAKSEFDRLRMENIHLAASMNAALSDADAVRRELDLVYRSRSWRLTAPLRSGKAAVFSRLRVLASPWSSSNGTFRKWARSAGEVGLGLARSSPKLKGLTVGLLKLAPSVDVRLRRFAELRPIPVPLPTVAKDAARLTITGVFGGGARRPAPRSGQEVILYCYVDHTVACPVNTGMQRVTRGLARSLIAAGEQLRFVKWDESLATLVYANAKDLEHLAKWQGPTLTPDLVAKHSSAEETLVVERHNKADGHWLVVPEVTHINHHGRSVSLDVIAAAKRCGLRTAFLFYDAIPLRRSEFQFMAAAHLSYMEQLVLADLVVPISCWAAEDLAALFANYTKASLAGCPPIRPALLPANSWLSPRVTQPRETESLILCVGTIEHRKNQLTLLRAFDAFVRDQDGAIWKLVLVGNVHPDIRDELDVALARNPNVALAGNVSDEELRLLYERCRFTVFPSTEEGFGLPIIESLWYGKPCLCAAFGAMAEAAAGGGCVTVNVREPTEILTALRKLAGDENEYKRLQSEIFGRQITTWSEYGSKVASLIYRETFAPNQLGTVYYFVEHTRAFPYNTGIQRVVRGLAKALLELDVALVAVRWNYIEKGFEPVSESELLHLGLWNGPTPDRWRRLERFPAAFASNDWLIVPELTAYPGGPDLNEVTASAAALGLRSALIFFDAVPWKLSDMYEHAEMHAAYMRSLAKFNRTLAISHHSRNDLVDFLRSTLERTPDLERRVVACPLPGEFPDTPREIARKPRGRGVVRILCVGSVERRKNHTILLHAFKRASARSRLPLELCIAGGCHLYPKSEAAFRAEVAGLSNARWEEDVSDSRLQELYADCDFTVYPSLEEGFGLPILESLWHARPCICRNSGAMAEVAEGGGCLTVDTAVMEEMEAAIVKLADDAALCDRLADEAIARRFTTWADYATAFAKFLVEERPARRVTGQPATCSPQQTAARFANIGERPLLSICISTYNRAGWLKVNLENLFRLHPNFSSDLEFLVCDNASTDETESVVAPFLSRSDFRYVRNRKNVGMLGNLRCTAHASAGQYVWVLGDDDLVKPGAIEHVLATLRAGGDLGLVYLNYAYTREDNPRSLDDVQAFLDSATPIVTPSGDRFSTVRDIAAESENFFTAIYCLVFRRDHALRAYTQDTEGRPFSTMLTAIPTTSYVLHHMLNERACWVGEPQVVVNMNVSWLKYAPLWILERIPEVYDRAEAFGVDGVEIDRWRLHTLPGLVHYFGEILCDDPEGNAAFFSPSRMVARFKHLPEFASQVPELRRIYARAHAEGIPAASKPVEQVFSAFENETETSTQT